MKTLAFRLLVPSIILVGGLLVIELLLIATDAGPRGLDLRGLHVPRPDRPWVYELRPGADLRLTILGDDEVRYRVNEAGFRDGPYDSSKPEDVFRIIVLGDSIAFGYGVEESESFPKRLESLLARQASSKRIEVFNFGVGGYNAYNEAAQFAEHGPRYAPDLVVLQFCINDLNDPSLHLDRHSQVELGRLPDAIFPNPDDRVALPERESTPARLCRKLRTCKRIHDFFWAVDLQQSHPEVFAATFAPRDGPEFAAEWQWLRERYREIEKVASDSGAPLVVVGFPFRGQLEGRATDRGQRRLRRIGDEEGWITIDLLPAFLERARSEPLLLDLWHPTAAGHRVGAEVIARELRCRGLVPIPNTADCDSDGS